VPHENSHARAGRAALKVICAGGAVVFVLLFLLSYGLKQRLGRNESQQVGEVSAQSPFDGERAYQDVEKLVAIGPRSAGSPGAAKVRAFLKEELEGIGLPVREQAFDAKTPDGVVKMVNLSTIVKGTQPGTILFGGHYDTKHCEDFEFVGANSGASASAWLLEMARTLSEIAKNGDGVSKRTVMLVWFDGKEVPASDTEPLGLYGSRAFVNHLQDRGQLDAVRTVITISGIGDRYLDIHLDNFETSDEPGVPLWLANAIRGRGNSLGHSKYFSRKPCVARHDHIPFREAGVPAICLADRYYGGSIADHGLNWHAERDQADLVCAGSLQVVGDVLYYALGEVNALLDKRPNPKARN
jgi:peptidase M28-like protein